jgi:WhiB family transcriptional regulator, redox-sensing transcriptional regulator
MGEYRTGKREGMAPMQWRAATVGGTDTTGFEAFGSAIRRESDVRQVQVGNIGQTCEVSVADQFIVAGPEEGITTALPIGLDLPCTEDPELFFAESPQDVELAKAMCRDCRARIACLTGALERREPWGVWGGELLMRGAIVPRKRPRGRPRKTEVAA